MACVSVQVQVERVFTDFYTTLRSWLIALKYTLPTHSQLEGQLKRYNCLLAHVLNRLLRAPEIDRLILEGMLQQFINTLVRIAHDVQSSKSAEEAYLHLRDLASQIAIFIYERYPSVRKNHLIEMFHTFIHAVRTEICFTLAPNSQLSSFDVSYQALASLRRLLDYLLYQIR